MGGVRGRGREEGGKGRVGQGKGGESCPPPPPPQLGSLDPPVTLDAKMYENSLAKLWAKTRWATCLRHCAFHRHFKRYLNTFLYVQCKQQRYSELGTSVYLDFSIPQRYINYSL